MESVNPSPPSPLPHQTKVIRLLPYAKADGPTNMAADETLLHSAVTGIASLRFYGWTSATLSLGYFQPAAVRLADAQLAQLPWVRRPSGGATLVHHHELNYCLALPAGSLWQAGEGWMPRMHHIITTALANLGLTDKITPMLNAPVRHGDILCFQQHTPGDLLSGDHKIAGSAQRRHRQAMMQHGSILLAQSEYTPDLPGIRELTDESLEPQELADAVVAAFAKGIECKCEPDSWSDAEIARTRELATTKYGTVAWNERR